MLNFLFLSLWELDLTFLPGLQFGSSNFKILGTSTVKGLHKRKVAQYVIDVLSSMFVDRCLPNAYCICSLSLIQIQRGFDNPALYSRRSCRNWSKSPSRVKVNTSWAGQVHCRTRKLLLVSCWIQTVWLLVICRSSTHSHSYLICLAKSKNFTTLLLSVQADWNESKIK